MKAVIPFIIEKGVWLLMIFLLPPLINLLVGVITYNPNSYIWVTLLSFPWQAYLGNAFVDDTFAPMLLLYLVIATGVFELSFLLTLKLYPKCTTAKEPYINKHGQNRLRIVIKFED